MPDEEKGAIATLNPTLTTRTSVQTRAHTYHRHTTELANQTHTHTREIEDDGNSRTKSKGYKRGCHTHEGMGCVSV